MGNYLRLVFIDHFFWHYQYYPEWWLGYHLATLGYPDATKTYLVAPREQYCEFYAIRILKVE